MALSEAFQHSVGNGYPLTVFVSPGWAQKGVSIGRGQNIECVNRAACAEDGLEVVRRPTDGYGLIHDVNDVTYGIAVPRRFVKSARDIDDIVLRVLQSSLALMDIPDVYDPFPQKYGNVFARDRKISGSAQSRGNKSWMQHGVIAVVRHRVDDYKRYFNGIKEPFRFVMTSVEEESGHGIEILSSLIASQIAASFSYELSKYGVEMKDSSLSEEEAEYADELLRTKYDTAEWVSYGTGRYDKSERVACFIE